MSESDGFIDLPVVPASAETSDIGLTIPDPVKNVYALLAFIEDDPNKPICMGFMKPDYTEMQFGDTGTRLNRHVSNTYDRLTKEGNWEYVFPDKTYMKIARTNEPEAITDLTARNIDSHSNPWKIPYDHDRQIIFGHSSGTKFRIGMDGILLSTAQTGSTDPNTLRPYPVTNLSFYYGSDGAVISNFKSLYYANNDRSGSFSIAENGLTTITGPTIIDATLNVTGKTMLPFETYVDNVRIDTLIKNIVTHYVVNHEHQYTDTNDDGSSTKPTGQGIITDEYISVPSPTDTSGQTAGGTGTDGTTGADGGTAGDTGSSGSSGSSGATVDTVTIPSVIAIGQPSGTGLSTLASPADHVHGLASPELPSPLFNYSISNVGTSLVPSRADHVHTMTNIPGLLVKNVFTDENEFSAGLKVTGGVLSAPILNIYGLPPLNAASRYVGATVSGKPTSGAFQKGDFIVDQTGFFWICTASGTSGSWERVGGVIPGYGTSALSTGASNLAGSSLLVSRQDHVHSVGAATVGTVAIVDGSVTPGKLSFTAATQADLNAHTSSMHLSIGTTDSTAAAGNHTHTLQSFVVVGGETSMLSASAVTIGGAPLTLKNYTGTGSLVISQTGVITLAGIEINLDASSVKINGVSIQNLAGTSPVGGTTGVVSSQSASEYTYTLRAVTTNDVTPATLTTNSSSPSATNMILVTSGEVWSYEIILTANSSAGTSVGRWTANGLIKRGATIASTALVNDPGIEGFFEPALENCIISISAENTTYGALAVAVTGIANTSIAWTASIKVSGIQTPLAATPTETFGSSGSTTGYGRFTFASGKFVTDGDSQYGVQVLRGSTSDTTPLVLTSNGLAVSSQNIPILSANSSWIFDIKVAANYTGSKAALWAFTGLMRRASTNASTYMVGLIDSKSISDPDLEDIEITIDANTSYGGISVQVKGIESTLLHWVATVQTTEVI